MKATKYYSVIAENGLMVSNSWSHVEKLRHYFRGNKEKSYKSREEAIIATRNGYNERRQFTKYYGEIKMNKPYFTKDMVGTQRVVPMVVFQALD